MRTLGFLGVFALCVLLLTLFECVFASQFCITASPESVKYRFPFLNYAIEFAAMNLHAESVKMAGRQLSSPMPKVPEPTTLTDEDFV